MLPARLRERFAAGDRRVVILLEDGRASLALATGDARQRLGPLDLGHVDLDPGADPPAALRTILRRHDLATALDHGALATGLRLPAGKALRTAIALPLAAESNLHEVISYELDRHTPFTAEQVYLSARVTRRDVAARRLEAELTVVPRPIVDDAVAYAERLGLAIDRVDIAGTEGEPASDNVLPYARIAAGRRKVSRATIALAVAAALFAAIAIYIPLARMQREAAVMEQDFAAIRATVSLQRQVEDLRKQHLFIVDRKRAVVPASTLLLKLTQILPDDTTLTTLQVRADEVQIGGTARSAAALIGLLEQSHEFTGTTFRTPVTQDPVTGRESFYIVTKVTAERAP